jgi:hypothetical protein
LGVRPNGTGAPVCANAVAHAPAAAKCTAPRKTVIFFRLSVFLSQGKLCETSSNINAHFFPRGEIRHRREKSVLIIGTGIREGASIFKIWVQPQT